MASLQDRQEGIIVKLFDLVHEADSYQPPELSVGDRILKGKFKNSPAEITGFTRDKHNQPVLKTNKGEVQLFKPRVTKLMDKDVAEDREYIPSGKTRITWNGIDLVVSIDGATVDIRAMTGDSQMAYVVFDRDGDTLVADDLAVEEQYKGQGIAKIMYDYVKELGFRVKRSSDQLVAGKKFWDKNKGAENNIWEQGVAEGAGNDIEKIIQSFVASPVGQQYKQHDCKTVTRAFVTWAEQNNILTEVITFAPPSAEFIKKNPQFQGKDGQGAGHIMPIVNDNAIDFTVRQFGVSRTFENPLVTPTGSLSAVYGKFGYFTDKPEWFSKHAGGKSYWIGALNSIPSEIFDQNFGDEILEQRVAESLDNPYPRNWNHNPDNDWRQDPDDSTEVYAKATLNDGTELAIRFQKDDGDRNEPGDWSVEFARNHSQEVTGEGDEKRIMATVLVAIQEFVTWYKPTTVTFSASKDPKPPNLNSPAGTKVNPQSRAKLYNRMVQRYAGAAGYSAQQREGNDKITYLLRRAKQGVAEGLNEFTPDNGGEITERINQKSIQAGFKDHQKVMGGKFDLYADSDGRTLTVELHDPNADFWEEAAWARFEVKGLFFMKNLQSLKTWVEPQYRRMGLATTIYQYVQNLGNTIKPAVVRTDMGKAMWKGFKSKGVAEGLQNIEIQDDKSIVTISVGGKERFVLQPATGHKLKSYGGRAYKYWTIYDIERKKDRFNPNIGMMSKNQAIAYVNKIIKREEDAAKVKPGVAEGTEEVNPLTNAVISFYKPVVDQIKPGAVDDYVKQAKELLNQAPDPTIRSRMLEIFRKGQKDPMIQGGVVTAIAAILTGGLLSSASRMGLSPAQTNILLQAVLNTVIPTIIARINNKSWRDTIKYTLASVGVGMTAAATLSEKRVTEGLSIDVPNEEWLQDKIDYAKSKGRDEWGAPFFGSTTAYARPNPQVSVVRLELLKGMRNEQNNVRKTDLEWLMAYMEKTGKLPPDPHGNEYAPYVMVAYNGEAWVNEGNHRIMAAFRLGWKKMPIEIKYFDGGERVESGIMYPGKIGLGRPAANPVREAYTGPQLKWLKPGELRGSYTDQQMRDRGFDRAGNGKWFILLSRWNELIAKKGIQ